MTQLPEQKPFIGGAYVDALSGERFATLNPATGEIIAQVQVAGAQDLDRTVAAARDGQRQWSAMTGAERGRILHAASRMLRERNDELARLETLDSARPLQETTVVDVISAADCVEFFAGVAATLHGSHIDLGGSFVYTRREPLGICAGIGAWNYPLQIAAWKSAPALACGNAMIFKPAELTPLTALKLAEIYAEAGVPPGVFNVLQGDAALGQLITGHKGIAKVSLTGEVGTGIKVMAASAQSLKHVTLELGGKSPLIIFEDARLDNAVSGALLANFYSQGEVCSNGTRVYVHESVLEEFLARLKARTEAMVIGDPMDMRTHVGALISEEHMDKVLGYIEAGKAAGARLVTGGERYTGNGCASGYYVRPTIFADCREDMAVVRDEIFGPVMTVLSFTDEDEVVARANDTEYGLAGGLFTSDVQRAHRVAAALEAGIVYINTYNLAPIEMPYGGYKLSGLGRENGLAAVEHYTQIKSVYVEMGDVEAPY